MVPTFYLIKQNDTLSHLILCAKKKASIVNLKALLFQAYAIFFLFCFCIYEIIDHFGADHIYMLYIKFMLLLKTING